MLKGEVWIKRLATEAQIEIATSGQLWQAYVAMLERMLLEGSCVNLSPLGYWSTLLQAEFVAVLEEEAYLCPPSLALSISPSRVAPSSESLGLSQLSYTTDLPEAVIVRWMSAIPSLTLDLLQAGQEVLWPRLGLWRLCDEELFFEPCEELCSNLNKPFEHFKPQALATRDLYPDLTRRELASLDELTKSRVITWSLQRVEGESLPVVEDDEVEPELLPSPMPQLVALEDELPLEITEDIVEPEPVVKRGNQYWFIALLLLALVMAALAVYYFTRPVKANQPIVLVELPSPDTLAKDPVVEVLDGAISRDPQVVEGELEKRDSTMPEQPKLEVERPSAPAPKPPVSSPQIRREAEGSANLSEEVELLPDESLAHIAKRKYGHRAFWVYIYEENRERIADPHRVPIGTKLELPPASKYGIDPRNTKSLERALVLSKSLENNNY